MLYEEVTTTYITNAVADLLMAMCQKHSRGCVIFRKGFDPYTVDTEQIFEDEFEEDMTDEHDVLFHIRLFDLDLRQVDHLIPTDRSPSSMSDFRANVTSVIPGLDEMIEECYAVLSNGDWLGYDELEADTLLSLEDDEYCKEY
jgi:hypothetical protein